MNSKLCTRGILVVCLALAGCSTPRSADNRAARTQSNRDLNAPANRRMITGSNIPQPVNRPTYAPTSANTPLESYNRDRPGLTPTEPVVGAGGMSDYRADEPSTGAGPAGSNPYPSPR